MVNISKFGDSAIKFTFTDNYRYLHNGEIEVPLNSLILVVDESDMVTFKKIDGDPFVSFLISDSNFESKETLIYFYKTSMVGGTGGGSESGITSGDVQTMIDTSLEDYYDIDDIDAALSGKADSSAVTESINAAVSGKQDTLIAGSGITISGNVISAEGGNLVIELTQAEYDALVDKDPNAFYIITDAQEINISDYYTSAQTQSAINAAVSGKADTSAVTEAITAAVSGKADTSSVYTKSEVDTALSGKQDTLIAGTNIKTINNESILGSGNIDIQGGGGKAISGGTNISITTGETADTINCTLPITFTDGFRQHLQVYYNNNTWAYAAHQGFVVGSQNNITGNTACIFGDLNNARGNASFIHGQSCNANGLRDTLNGFYLNATNKEEFSSGQYNISVSASTTFGDSGNTLFSVGNGTADNARHNAFEIRQNGDIYITKDGADVKLQDNLGGGVSESAFTSYSAATDARMSEDEEVTAAALNALNDKFDGLRLKKLTQSEYEALTVKDNNTLYILVG